MIAGNKNFKYVFEVARLGKKIKEKEHEKQMDEIDNLIKGAAKAQNRYVPYRPAYSMNQYQIDTLRTASVKNNNVDFEAMICSMGLAGEAGEVADYLKKVYGHDHPMDKERLKKELGDVLWYISRMASLFGMSLDEVAQENIAKLKTRYPNGFSSEQSMNRKEGDV